MCFLKHLRIRTVSIKLDVETEEEGDKSEYRNKHSGQEKSLDGLAYPEPKHGPKSCTRLAKQTYNSPKARGDASLTFTCWL